ncbi:MAG: hypothetical protein ACREN3_09345 [Gemmatimonadaceae bacterium]
MTARRSGGWSALLAVAATAALAGGCFSKPKHPVPAPLPVTLQIVSHAFADIDVYVLPAPGVSGIRLTTVSGFSKATVRLRTMQLQPGNVLQLQLHAIGSTADWLTAALPVSPGDRVILELNSDATGNLSRSVLYPLPDDNPGGGSAPPPPR